MRNEDRKRMKESNNLSFEVVDISPEDGSFDGLQEFIADLLVERWMEEESIGDGQDSTKGSKESDRNT